MANKQRRALCVCVIALASTLAAQSFNATISGTVLDTSGAAVPGAQVTLSSLETGSVAKTESNGAGLYAFPNLLAGSYKLSISSPGFGSIVQNRITIAINQSIRFDVTLHVGIQTQTVQVSANASALNFDNAEQAHGLAPETIGELPLLGSGNIRAAVGFVVLMPGVSTGAADETTPEAARFNGGIMGGVRFEPASGQARGIKCADQYRRNNFAQDLKHATSPTRLLGRDADNGRRIGVLRERYRGTGSG
jgi:hypothetical protein